MVTVVQRIGPELAAQGPDMTYTKFVRLVHFFVFNLLQLPALINHISHKFPDFLASGKLGPPANN